MSAGKSRLSKSARLLGLAGAMIVLLALAFVLHTWSGFREHFHNFSFHVKNADKEYAQKELDNLRHDHQLLTRWKLGYWADQYLFSQMFLYEAELALLAEDYEKVIEILKDRQDESLALHLTGIAKFRLLQAAFQKEKTDGGREKLVDRALEEVRPHFEKAVKNGPGPSLAFDYSFNYDLLSNRDSARTALKNPQPVIVYVLGREPGQSGDKSDRKGALKEKLNSEKGPKPGKGDGARKG